MSIGKKDIDKLTRDLLQKSLVKPIDPDFDDILMKKILSAPLPAAAKPESHLVKNGWRFLMLAFGLLIASVIIITYLSSGTKLELNQFMDATRLYVLYGGLALFVPLLFIQFDALLKMMFQNHFQPKIDY
jgi:hypothetical protein